MNENYNTDGVMKQDDIVIQKSNRDADNGNKKKAFECGYCNRHNYLHGSVPIFI